VLELGAGPPLLLLHGGGDGAFQWVPILRSLAKRHRVFAVDRPGHGLADAFDYGGVDFLEHARTFVGDVLDVLELEKSALLANSTGGLWAAVYALAEPDRVSRLVIAGAPPGVTREAPLPMRLMGVPFAGRPLGRLMMGKPSREGNRKFWGQLLVVHPERLSDELLDVDVAHMRRNVESVLGLLGSMIGPRGVRHHVVLGTRWSALEVPTLFVCGERDALFTHRMAQAWESFTATSAHIRVVRVPAAGHLPWMDEPERVLLEVESFLGAE
jgi:pimeloyl-ACP methyl ester carboxylesterase